MVEVSAGQTHRQGFKNVVGKLESEIQGGDSEDVLPVWDDRDVLMSTRSHGFTPVRGAGRSGYSTAADDDALPIWDEATGGFWCSTSVNAYDIPDGLQWQQAFKEALTIHEPDFFVRQTSDRRRHHNDLRRNIPTPCRPSVKDPEMATTPAPNAKDRSASPTTPKKLPMIRGKRESPKTPPLFRAASPQTRALRATHTKALLSIKQKAGITAIVQGREIAFFRFGGEIFAVAAKCPHQGGNLCEGEIGDIEDLLQESGTVPGGKHAYVTCPVHKMQFDLRDGAVIDGNCAPLQTYRVRISEVDEVQKLAPVEVSFETLDETYFGELEY
jgi:nitrite reductase/ring-hydroxylating ferredoxin subunit